MKWIQSIIFTESIFLKVDRKNILDSFLQEFYSDWGTQIDSRSNWVSIGRTVILTGKTGILKILILNFNVLMLRALNKIM